MALTWFLLPLVSQVLFICLLLLFIKNVYRCLLIYYYLLINLLLYSGDVGNGEKITQGSRCLGNLTHIAHTRRKREREETECISRIAVISGTEDTESSRKEIIGTPRVHSPRSCQSFSMTEIPCWGHNVGPRYLLGLHASKSGSFLSVASESPPRSSHCTISIHWSVINTSCKYQLY
jgi:hypothetical protein